MKYVSGAEIFQSEKTVSVRAEECLKGEPALKSEMERLITENICLQRALRRRICTSRRRHEA